MSPVEREQDVFLGGGRATSRPEPGASPGIRRVRPAVLGVTLALMPAALEPMAVATALPEIVHELGARDRMPSVLTAYLLTAAAGLLLFGGGGERYGHKRAFQTAILLFVAGSALAGRAQTMDQLTACRALQGLAAGGLMSGAQAILAGVVPADGRARGTAVTGAAFGLASLAGPLLGGLLTDRYSWRWCFHVTVPLGLLALVLVTLGLRSRKSSPLPEADRTSTVARPAMASPAPAAEPRTAQLPHHRPRFDVLGALLLCGLAGCLVLLTASGGHAWDSPLVLGLGGGACVAALLLPLVERFAARPLIPPRFLGGRGFAAPGLVGLTTGAALFGVAGWLPVQLRLEEGVGATETGLLMLPLTGSLVGASVLCGRLAVRTGGHRAYAVLGCALAAVGLWLLSGPTADTSRLHFCVWTALFGAGLGTVMPVLVLVVQNVARPADLTVATDVHTCLRQFGGAVGAAVVGGLLAHRFGGADGARVTYPLVPVLVLGLLASCFLRRPPEPEDASPRAQVPHARPADGEGVQDVRPEYTDAVLLRGTVRRSDGGPVPGAVLTLIDVAGRQTGRCAGGSDGRYALGAPGAGSYVLVAVAPGHQPRAVGLMVGGSPVVLDVVLGGVGRLVGTVRNSEGGPVADATVTLTDVHGEVAATVRGGLDGAYVVSELPAGEYTLAACAPAFRQTALPVSVRTGSETRQDVELAGGTMLRGTVRARGGRPVEDARVTVLDPAGNVVGALTTGGDGGFRFGELTSGEYTVVAAGYAPVATVLRVAEGGRAERDLHLGHEV